MTEVIDAAKGDLDAVVVGAAQASDLRHPVGWVRDVLGAGEIERCHGSYLQCDGETGSFASIDSTSLLDITDSQFEIWIDIAARFWSGGTSGPGGIGETFCARWAEDTDQRSWMLSVGGGGGGGSFDYAWSSTGANRSNIGTPPQLFTVANHTIRQKFRVMYDVRTANIVENRLWRRFSDNDPWINMSKHFQSGFNPLFNGTADLRIGDHGPGPVPNPYTGQFFSFRLWDGVRERGGVEIVNIDFTKIRPGVTSFQEDAQGLTVNINGSAEIKHGGSGSRLGDFRYRMTGVGDHHPLILRTDANIELLRGRLNVLKSHSRSVVESSGSSLIDPSWDSDLRVPILKAQSSEEYATAIRNATGETGVIQLESQSFSEVYFDELRMLVLERVSQIRERIIHV